MEKRAGFKCGRVTLPGVEGSIKGIRKAQEQWQAYGPNKKRRRTAAAGSSSSSPSSSSPSSSRATAPTSAAASSSAAGGSANLLVVRFDQLVAGLAAGGFLEVNAHGDKFKVELELDDKGEIEYFQLRRNKKARAD